MMMKSERSDVHIKHNFSVGCWLFFTLRFASMSYVTNRKIISKPTEIKPAPRKTFVFGCISTVHQE